MATSATDGKGARTAATPAARAGAAARMPALILTAVIGVILGLSLWYLVLPQPLLVQGEADATRIDIAARVDGRIGRLAVARGDNVAAGATLIAIDNPELLAKLREARAAKDVAGAELARIRAGTRPEAIAVSKANVDSAAAGLTLARQTYERTKELASRSNAPLQTLDQNTAALQVAQQTYNQAQLAYREAQTGFTREEHQIAEASVAKAQASIDTLQALVDQTNVTAPIAAQIYQINTEPGEFVAPGVPLLSLVDLGDVWLHFDLREDLIKGLKVGDRFAVRVPALGDRSITAEVKVIAAKGEYAGWRATRATGDFDLRTFAVRAYPVERIADLRPGMSVYADWATARR